MNDLFEQWRVRIDTLIREHPLQIISWEATRRCNLRCIHCGSPEEDAQHRNELSTDEVVSAFDQIANDFDMNQFHHINITGGEPFVRQDLVEILKRISAYPFYRNIDIQTNGIYINDHPDVLSELKKYGVTGLGVSIDGFENTHDSFRRRTGSFSKAVNAARLSVDEGYTVSISVVAHSKNVDEIPSLFEYVRKVIKPRIFRIMTLDPIGRTELDSEYLLSPAQLRKVMDFLKREYQRSCSTYSNPEVTMVELGCGGWMGKNLEGMFRPFIFHCIAGLNNLGLLYDGKIASCSNISREFIEGDLRRESIKEVWEKKYQRYRNPELRRKTECRFCDDWDFCHGGPMHLLKSAQVHSLCRLPIYASSGDYGDLKTGGVYE